MPGHTPTCPLGVASRDRRSRDARCSAVRATASGAGRLGKRSWPILGEQALPWLVGMKTGGAPAATEITGEPRAPGLDGLRSDRSTKSQLKRSRAMARCGEVAARVRARCGGGGL